MDKAVIFLNNFINTLTPQNGDWVGAIVALITFLVTGVVYLLVTFISNARRVRVENHENYHTLKERYENKFDSLQKMINEENVCSIFELHYKELKKFFPDKLERKRVKTKLHRIFDIMADAYFTTESEKDFTNYWGGEIYSLLNNKLFFTGWEKQRTHFIKKSESPFGGERYQNFIVFMDDLHHHVLKDKKDEEPELAFVGV